MDKVSNQMTSSSNSVRMQNPGITFSAQLRKLRRAVETLPFVARTYRKLRDRKIRRPSYTTVFGFQLTGDPGLDTGRVASGEAEVFLSVLSNSETLIDIGANVGLFTLIAATRGVPVVAIEPDEHNLRLLLHNVSGAMTNAEVEIFPLALAERPGIMPLFGSGQGATLTRGWGDIAPTSNYSRLVPVSTLDNLVADRFAGKRLLIKMDAEGFEWNILHGAVKTLSRDPRPVWIVEHGLTTNFPGGVNPHFEDLFAIFWAAGYGAQTLEGHTVSRSDVTRWMANGRVDSKDLNFVFA